MYYARSSWFIHFHCTGIEGFRWGEMTSDERRMIFWESPCGGVCIHQLDYLEVWDGDGADVRLWVTAVLSSEVLAWLTTKLLRVLVCRRIDDCSGLPYRITRNCAVFAYDCNEWKNDRERSHIIRLIGGGNNNNNNNNNNNSDRQFTVRGMLIVLCELEFFLVHVGY